MIDNLSRLDQILQIPDRSERRKALERLAEEVGVFTLKKTSRHDFYNEERLVLAIYDGFIARKKDWIKNRVFLIRAFCVFVLLIALVILVPKKIIAYFRLLSAKNEEHQKSYKGYDEHGKLVRDENGQPVLFHEMNGYYDEFYNEGQLHFSYLYKDGKVTEQIEYDRGRNVIVHIVYDEEGNPHLKEKE